MLSHSREAEAAAPPLAPDATPEERRADAAAVWRSPAVLVPAIVLAAACVVRYEAEARGFISGFTAAVLVVLAATDLKARLIPNRVVVPAAAIVLAAQLALYTDRAVEWVVGALGAATFLFLPSLVRRGAIGMGDVKLALLMGASLGYVVLSALTLGFLLMLPVAGYMLFREGTAARKMYLPLGPFLALGTVIVLLTGGASG